jgi:glycosyltransferase involved in cell wall biosynthesis
MPLAGKTVAAMAVTCALLSALVRNDCENRCTLTFSQLTLPSFLARRFWKTKVALGRRQADMIVTVSDCSRRGILSHFNIAPDKVAVVGEASHPIFRVLDEAKLTPRLRELGMTAETRFIVYVGGFNPHKYLETLVAAFARLVSQDSFSETRLIMVGEYEKDVFHSYFATIKEQVGQLRIANRVIFTGYLPNQDLVVLLNLATALVLPSLIEGFGLLAIEASACGCPVIATTTSPLPELLGDAGVFIDQAKCGELEVALAGGLGSESLRRWMREAGLEAARRLTWDRATQQMIHLIRKVIRQ